MIPTPIINVQALSSDLEGLSDAQAGAYLRLILMQAKTGTISHNSLCSVLDGQREDVTKVTRLLKTDDRGYYIEWLRCKPLRMPFDSLHFLEWWNALCSQPKWKKKTQTALQLSLNKLHTYSKGDEKEAIIIIKETIANGYQGIFPLKTYKADVTTSKQNERVNGIKDILTGKTRIEY